MELILILTPTPTLIYPALTLILSLFLPNLDPDPHPNPYPYPTLTLILPTLPGWCSKLVMGANCSDWRSNSKVGTTTSPSYTYPSPLHAYLSTHSLPHILSTTTLTYSHSMYIHRHSHTLIYSLSHSLTYSLPHSLPHSLTPSLPPSLPPSLTPRIGGSGGEHPRYGLGGSHDLQHQKTGTIVGLCWW